MTDSSPFFWWTIPKETLKTIMTAGSLMLLFATDYTSCFVDWQQLPCLLTNDYFPLFKCVTHEIWLGSSVLDPLGDHQREKSINHDLEFLMCMHWELALELCLTYAHTPTHTFVVVYLFHTPPPLNHLKPDHKTEPFQALNEINRWTRSIYNP